jgi:hypothetical protein
MKPQERQDTPMVEFVAVADHVIAKESDKETNARSTNALTAKCTIIPPMHAEREKGMKMTQTTVTQTPPGTMSEYFTIAVSMDSLRKIASSSNMTGNNKTK